MGILSNVAIMLGNTILYATPLIFAALGGTFSERSGVVNIGLEGMMTIGAMTAWVGSAYTGSAWMGFLMGGFAGASLALFHAIACVSFKANQVVSGVAINFLGAGISLLVYDEMKKVIENYLIEQFKPIQVPFLRDIPVLGEALFSNDATQYIAIGFAVIASIFLYKTTFGLRLRAVGEQPRAADTLGINVYRVRYFAVIMSGFLAGLGGGSVSIAIQSEYTPATIAGQGFIALAAMIFGKWKPIGVLFACLFFGFVQGGLDPWIQTKIVPVLGDESVIKGILDYVTPVLPYLLTILALVIFVGKAVAPAASGVPYEKGER
jgi:general nucleoside transport system permease protein